MSGLEELRHALLVFSFSLPRILGTFVMLPIFSRESIPGTARTGIAASLALFAFPIVATGAPPQDPSLLVGMGLLVKESFLGSVIGFSAAILFWAIESVGFFIDNSRGASMASSIDPLTGSQTSPIGILLTQTLTVIFFVGGGFLYFLGALFESYQFWPVFSFFPTLRPEGAVFFLGLMDRLVGLTVFMAAPVIISMFLAEFGLGLISRFAPQLNVFFLAMPVKSAIAFLVLVIYASVLLGYFGDELRQIPAQVDLLRRIVG
jgi:type III secretion protein T